MADIEVIFNTDNAAFADDRVEEIKRVMAVATLMTAHMSDGEMPIFDSNGNSIGFARVTGRDEKSDGA